MADNNKSEDADDFAAINTPGGHTSRGLHLNSDNFHRIQASCGQECG